MEGSETEGCADTVTPAMMTGGGGELTHCARRGRFLKRSAWQRDGNHVDDGQNHRGLLIPVSVSFIAGEKAALPRCLEEE